MQETQVRAKRRIEELLPDPWLVVDGALSGGASPEVQVLELVGPSGSPIRFVVVAKRARSLPAELVPLVMRDAEMQSNLPALLISDYIGPVVRKTLAKEGMSYADTTGWVRITHADPLVLLTGIGADRAPKARDTEAVRRLDGLASSRTIRTLATAELPLGVRQLADLAQVSPGSVSKLLTTLSAEGIVDRDVSGSVTSVRRRELIRRWTQDYSFAKSNHSVGYYIAVRGLGRAIESMDQLGQGFALTGSAAAKRILPPTTISVVPMRLLAAYCSDQDDLAKMLMLIEADPKTANVVLASPQDPKILPSTGLGVAPTPLVIADLMTLPGRAEAEADQLMDFLASSDHGWE